MKILLQKKPDLEKQSMFFHQLAAILQSGLSLLAGLSLLQERAKEDLLLCYRLQRSLNHGYSLAEAMAAEPEHFSTLSVSMIAVGEESGELVRLLEELAAYYARQAKLVRFIRQAALYPMLLLVLSLALLVLFGLYILPVLLETYAAMGIRPSGRLGLLLELRVFFVDEPLKSIAIAAVVSSSLGYCGRRLWLAFISSHWSGNFHGLLLEVRLCKLLTLLLEAGLSITRAVDIIAESVEDKECRRQLKIFSCRLQRGMAIEQAAAGAEKLFSPLTLELICVGAATGYLPQMLGKAAAAGDMRIEEQLERLRQLLVPILLLIAALVVAVVVITIISPLFELLTALPE